MNQKQIITLLLLATSVTYLINRSAQSSGNSQEFQLWKRDFGVKYSSSIEEYYRRKIFLQNVAIIHQHNSNSGRTYDVGINQFTAMSHKQFVVTYLTLLPQKQMINTHEIQPQIIVGDVDWIAYGAVTPVKDDGKCGACWAFTATGALEGLSKIVDGNLESFSEQQLLDCTLDYGNYGCNGGFMTNSFQFVKEKGTSLIEYVGIVTENIYPYKGVYQKCLISGGPYKVSGFIEITKCSELASSLNARPIAVAVDASYWSNYKSGVFNNCGTNLNFSGTLVGLSAGIWKIKNQWGLKWGEEGYIRLAAGNTCGLCNMASFPIK